MISNIVVYNKRYYYKGIEYEDNNLNSLLNIISKKRRIILCSQSILIKKYNYSSSNIEKFIDNKILEDFTNKNNLLFHYEINKDNKEVYLYSIRNNIRRLYENVKELKIELLQFNIKSNLEKKIRKLKNVIVIYRINNTNQLVKIKNNIIVDSIVDINIDEIKSYLNEEKNEEYTFVKDNKCEEINGINFNYFIDLGVETYEKICEK